MKLKSRILAFLNAYSQGKNGGDMVFVEVAKRVKTEKIIITSKLGKKLCLDNKIKAKFLITSSEEVFRNPIKIYLKRILSLLFKKFNIKNQDILLATSDFLPDVLPCFFLKNKNSQAVWVQHVFHLISKKRIVPFVAQKISFIFIKMRADLVIVDNFLLKKELIKNGFDHKKIFLNYPGINLSYLKKIKAKNRVDNQSFDTAFMARLNTSKGVFDLIKIWAIVCRGEPRRKLAIIGRGDEKTISKMKVLVERMKISKNVKFFGFLEDDLAYSLIKSCKIFIFPSHEEGFGIAPLEAQALGVPVVAWDIPPFKEVFKKGMIRINKGNIAQFSKQVTILLNNANKRNLLKKQAFVNASRFSWQKTARREFNLIKAKL